MPNLAAMLREAKNLRAEMAKRNPPGSILWTFKRDPAELMARAGMLPDPWQAALLRSPSRRMQICCSRQSGKSQVGAALALRAALLEAPALILIISASERQAKEMFGDKIMRLYNLLDRPVAAIRETTLTVTLANGSRIICLPADQKTIVGYSNVRLIIIDEGSRVKDEVYLLVRPMLAVSKGRMVCLSTPYGKRGWFFEEWHKEDNEFLRTKITADQCPRFTSDFLEQERKTLGDRLYRQEYEGSFEEVIDAVFDQQDILAACDNSQQVLFGGGQ